jgi:hypothetical protein
MNNHRFLVYRSAALGYSRLTAEERAALERVLAPLAAVPQDRWPTAGAVRLESPEPLYFVRVDDSLRAIIRPAADGRPEILDFVRHETLELFFKGAGNRGPRA